MPVLVKTIGILVICLAAIALFSPATTRRIVQYMKEGKRLAYAAASRVLIGALLIAASFSCRSMGVVLGLGIFTVLVGGVPLALGIPRMQVFVDWWMAKSDGVLRAMTVIALLFGAALVYAA